MIQKALPVAQATKPQLPNSSVNPHTIKYTIYTVCLIRNNGASQIRKIYNLPQAYAINAFKYPLIF
ncbi:MAG: hypothetical protein ACM31E_10955, partial [Fibrobacterota bacterium]